MSHKPQQSASNDATQREHEWPIRDYETISVTILLLTRHDLAERLYSILQSDQSYTPLYVQSDDNALELLRSGEHEIPIAVVSVAALQSNPELAEKLRTAASTPLRIIALHDGSEQSGAGEGGADVVVGWPWHDQELLTHVQSQLWVQQQTSQLITQVEGLLGTSLAAMDLARSLRLELEAQTAVRHELVHRVSTHIGALRDYLELEVRRLPLGLARDSMRNVLYRIRNLSALYDVMGALELEDPVDFGKLAGKIGQGVKALYSPRSKLPLVVQGELQLPATSASPLSLAVNELITNAYRHAFPAGRFGKIIVSCGSNGGAAWCSVEDNGVGMERLPDTTVRRVGGVYLVQRLVRSALGGRCAWQTGESGTTAMVQFPYQV